MLENRLIEDKEDFYIRTIMDHVLLEKEEYEKIRKDIDRVKTLERQVQVYEELLAVIAKV